MGREVPGRPRIGVPISTDAAPHEELLAEPDQVWRPTSPRPPGVPLVDRQAGQAVIGWHGAMAAMMSQLPGTLNPW